jgi:hypothetical protein
MWFCDMPAPAPPPRLIVSSADVQAGAPDVAATEPAALAEADADAADADDAALAAGALALDVPDGELAETPVGDDDDDAAHPAASTPAASSGTASSAFFTRLPSCRGLSICHSCP